MTGLVHGFYVWGLAGGSVLGLLFIFALVLSLTFAIADRITAVIVRVRQRRARARFTREARAAAVERMLARYRLELTQRDPIPDELDERIKSRVADEFTAAARARDRFERGS